MRPETRAATLAQCTEGSMRGCMCLNMFENLM